jgi:hypothetical protein
MKVAVPLLIAVVLAVLGLTACGGGREDWYAEGKSYSIASGKAQGNALLIGVTPQKWCSGDIDLGKPSLGGVSLNGPSLSDRSAVNSWVSGCVAGYWSQHPDQPRVGSTPLAGGSSLSARSARYWLAIGRAVAVSASQTAGIDITQAGKTAATGSAWCADIMFLPQPTSLKAKLQAHLPAPGAESIQWVKGCEVGAVARAAAIFQNMAKALRLNHPARFAADQAALARIPPPPSYPAGGGTDYSTLAQEMRWNAEYPLTPAQRDQIAAMADALAAANAP